MGKCILNQSLANSATCPAGQKKTVFFDTNFSGFALEVRETGGRTWYLYYHNARGKKRQFRIGDAKFVTFDQARKSALKVKQQTSLGQDPCLEKKLIKQIPTVQEFVDQQFLPHIKSNKLSWDTDRSYLKNHILPKIGRKHLDEVKRADIVAIINGMREQEYAVGTCNRVLILCRYIFNCVRKWGVNKQLENPCQSVTKFQDDIAKERYLTEEEARHLFEAVCDSDNPMLRYIVPILILSGARKQEVLKARWEDFDFDRRQWRIPKSKNGKHRYVPMSDTMIQVLRSIPGKKNVWVFPNRMTGKPYVNIFNSWNTARTEANLADVRMHDLRHSFASFLVNSGRTLYEVQKILGHTQIKTTQRYAHLSQDRLLEATNSVGGLLEASFLPKQSSTEVFMLSVSNMN